MSEVIIIGDGIEKSDKKAAPVERRVMWQWHKLLDMEVLTGNGDKMGDQVAVVYPNGVWHTWDKDGNGMENSSEIGVYEAKCAASFSAIKQGLLDT